MFTPCPYFLICCGKTKDDRKKNSSPTNNNDDYRNPGLGLATKVKACEVIGQQGSFGATSHVLESAKECEGMNPHIPK
jgi:hypothetical protein